MAIETSDLVQASATLITGPSPSFISMMGLLDEFTRLGAGRVRVTLQTPISADRFSATIATGDPLNGPTPWLANISPVITGPNEPISQLYITLRKMLIDNPLTDGVVTLTVFRLPSPYIPTP